MVADNMPLLGGPFLVLSNNCLLEFVALGTSASIARNNTPYACLTAMQHLKAKQLCLLRKLESCSLSMVQPYQVVVLLLSGISKLLKLGMRKRSNINLIGLHHAKATPLKFSQNKFQLSCQTYCLTCTPLLTVATVATSNTGRIALCPFVTAIYQTE